MNGFAFVLRALRSRNYRLFFAGQLVSLIGTWMTATATSWLVYRLSGSAYLLGVVGFAGQFPAFLVAPLSGILVDRWDKRRILIATQTLSMAQSFALAFLTLTHRIGVGSVLLLQALQGIVNAFDVPCRQSFVVEMLDRKEDLGNAIALNSSMMNAARLIGPSIAGVLIAASGEGPCFLIDGVSYAGVIAGLLAMRIAPRPPRRDA
ncbi:MAG TPA: MFS transporter, partial [Elusimicrobiota bacterium]|nr:MFS transporter [Elusimicrobiota bacterium]